MNLASKAALTMACVLMIKIPVASGANDMTMEEKCKNIIIASIKTTTKKSYSANLNIKIIGGEAKYDNEQTVDMQSILASNSLDICMKCDIVTMCKNYLPISAGREGLYCERQCEAQIRKQELENKLTEIQLERPKVNDGVDKSTSRSRKSSSITRGANSQVSPKSSEGKNTSVLAFLPNELPRQIRNSFNLCLDHSNSNSSIYAPVTAEQCRPIVGQHWYRQGNMLRTPNGYCLDFSNNPFPGGRLRLISCPQIMASWTTEVGQPLQSSGMCIVPRNQSASGEVVLEACGMQSKRFQMFGP